MKTQSVLVTRKLTLGRELRSNIVFQKDDCYFFQVVGSTLLLHPTLPEYCREFCKVHLASASSRNRCITIPVNIIDALGWQPGADYITFRRGKNSEIFLNKATSEEIIKFAAKTARKATVDNNIRKGRYLYLTKSQREFLRIPKGAENYNIELKVTIDFSDKVSIKIEPIGKDEKLPTMMELLKKVGRKNFYSVPRTYRLRFRQCVILPVEFARRVPLDWDSDCLSFKADGNGLLFYYENPACNITGKKTDTSMETMQQIPVCQECESVIPAVRRKVEHSDCDIDLALVAARNELRDVLDTLDKFIC